MVPGLSAALALAWPCLSLPSEGLELLWPQCRMGVLLLTVILVSLVYSMTGIPGRF